MTNAMLPERGESESERGDSESNQDLVREYEGSEHVLEKSELVTIPGQCLTTVSII